MGPHFCSQIGSVLDIFYGITNDLCGHQGNFNTAWMLSFFSITVKGNDQIQQVFKQ